MLWGLGPSLLPLALFGALVGIHDEANAAGLIPHEVVRSRQGLSVVVVPSTNARWAVVQLHVRTAGEGLPAAEAQALEAVLHALAEGRTDRGPSAADRVRGAGGETRVARTLDGFTVSDGVPAAFLDVALRALDERLKARRKLSPAPPARTLAFADDQTPPPLVRQLMAPGHPYGYSDDGDAEAEAVRTLLDRVLRRENVVIVVVAPSTPAVTLARVNRFVKTPLPRGALVTPETPELLGVRVVEGGGSSARDAGAGLWFPLAPSGEQRARQRATLEVLAVLTGGDAGASSRVGWLSLPTAAKRAPGVDGTSGARTEELARVAELTAIARSLDERSLEGARRLVRTSRARQLRSPEALAFALGRAHVEGGTGLVDDVEAALDNLSAPGVAAIAERLAVGPRIAVRPVPAGP